MQSCPKGIGDMLWVFLNPASPAMGGAPEMLMALRENTQKVLMGPRYALPAPEDVNPVYDDGPGMVVKDEEDIIDVSSQPEKSEGKLLGDMPTLLRQINGRISEDIGKSDSTRENFKKFLFMVYLPKLGHAKPDPAHKLSLKEIPLVTIMQDIMPNWDDIVKEFINE